MTAPRKVEALTEAEEREKACTRCGEVKPLTAFAARRHGSLDGRRSHCLVCGREERIAYRNHHRADESARNKARRPEKAAWLRGKWKRSAVAMRERAREKYRKADRIKLAARRAVREAVERGALTRCACERCGRQRVHAHHDDYARPLMVRWLCPVHHMEAHRG
jgi:hypothetical protein